MWGSGYKVVTTPKGSFEGHLNKKGMPRTGLKPGMRYRMVAIEVGKSKEE